MASPKSKDSSLSKKELLPARHGGSNAKPRPRPVRPTSRYSPAEVHEIFRRFSVQRPEPK
ncbi:endonuclease III, partial [Mesorhizobium sp. M7A.T.Ca.TU.009.01.3.1]